MSWNDDSIQFPRLLDELAAVGVPQLLKEAEWQALEESMDLPREKIMTLFGRAHYSWNKIKAAIIAPATPTNEEQTFDEVECPVCRHGTVGLEDDEVHCRGECGTVWMKDQWDREMKVRRSLAEPGTLTTIPDDHPLIQKQDTDLVLKDGVRSVWIEVDNLVVYVRRTFRPDPAAPDDRTKDIPEGVAIDITPLVSVEETMDCCSATFEDAKDYECQKCGAYTGGIGYDFCEDCDPRQPCGHPNSAIVSSDEGTSYCGLCEKEAS